MRTIHAGIFPFHRERTAIADVVQCRDNVLEPDVAAAERPEIPKSPRIGKIGVAAENAHGAVAVAPPHIFHMHVEDAITKFADESDVVHALVGEVRRIVIEAKTFVMFDSIEGAVSRSNIKRDFGRMDFEGEINVFLIEDFEDGQPAFGEIRKPALKKFLAGGRKRVDCVPDARAGKTIDDGGRRRAGLGFGIEEFSRGAGGGLHLFSGAPANAFRVAVAPDISGKDCLVPFIGQIANSLADEVIGDGEARESVFSKKRPFLFDVIAFGERPVYVEMAAPTAKFEAIVAHRPGFWGEFNKRQIGPLTGEERDGAWHVEIKKENFKRKKANR